MMKSAITIFSLILLVVVSMAFTKDEPKYKNLKILPKNITDKQLDSVMHHFTAALNVKCNFCHVRREGEEHPDFASDDNKHKLRAREMMKMTEKLNKKYFNVTGGKITISTPLMVTCYTCHHGSNDPARRPPRMERPQQRTIADSTKRM
ncbi:MAG: c-type cytochrome [Candidatus Dadabacteria bacterium]